jgi:NAD(P)-dependent dehydrogenase (short-subunit alcohol dehydrogenase family)
MTTKTALVTGASSGIGEATVRKLQGIGCTVYGAARRTDRLQGLAADGIRPLAMDVTDDASMSAGIEQIIADTGRIDVLVNNAGYGSYGALEDVPIDEGRRQFEVNVIGDIRARTLRAAGGGGGPDVEGGIDREPELAAVGGGGRDREGGDRRETEDPLRDGLRRQAPDYGPQLRGAHP